MESMWRGWVKIVNWLLRRVIRGSRGAGNGEV